MQTAAWLLLSNSTVNLLIVGLIAAGISLVRQPRPWSAATFVEVLLSYFVLFSIGVSYVMNFIMHVFFSEMTAGFIGWADSPFQKEVGFASLGFALLGFLAFRGSFDMRLAAVLGPSAFLWGAAPQRDDVGSQLRAWQCRRRLLHRYLPSPHWPHPRLVAAPAWPRFAHFARGAGDPFAMTAIAPDLRLFLISQ